MHENKIKENDMILGLIHRYRDYSPQVLDQKIKKLSNSIKILVFLSVPLQNNTNGLKQLYYNLFQSDHSHATMDHKIIM